MQFYILKTPEIRNNAINFINALNIDFKEYAVEIKPYKKNRSSAQNRLYWSWVNIIAEEIGYTPDEAHELFKVRLLGTKEVVFTDKFERAILSVLKLLGIDRLIPIGTRFSIPKSTTELTTKEFTDYLEKIELTAAEMGIVLPHPSDYSYIMGAQ